MTKIGWELLALFAFVACVSCGGSNRTLTAKSASPTTIASLTSWTLTPTSLNGAASEFGNVVYDPESSNWRMFYSAKSVVFSVSGPTSTSFPSTGTVALGFGPKGAWDSYSVNVPYVWYEVGQARPWRMLYRGSNGSSGLSTSLFQIGLATAAPEVDGVIDWQREDTHGAALTAPVIPEATTGWSANQFIDFGSVMKYGGNYYIYYSTISNPRQIGLATSVNLVYWKQYPLNPLFKGVVNTASLTQGPDKYHAGVLAPDQGFFCPDIVYWPNSDGSARWVLIVPHYSANFESSLDVFTSTSPVFLSYLRQYAGKIIATANTTYTLDGSPAIDVDTPRIITDDISRNVVTSKLTGGKVTLVASINTSTLGWRMVDFFWNPPK